MPAEITYYKNGQLKKESWYEGGKLHRVNLPAEIIYYENGKVERESWYKGGKKYREGNLPDEIYYFATGNLRYKGGIILS